MFRGTIPILAVTFCAATFVKAAEYRYEIINLGILPDTLVSNPDDISNNGLVTGTSYQGGNYRAFIAGADMEMQNLGTLPAPFDWGSYGIAINNAGQVAGISYLQVGNTLLPHAFVHTPGEGMIDIGTLGGATAEPYAMNDLGQVVGSSAGEGDESWERHPFLWSKETGMINLAESSNGGYERATDINNLGQVVGVLGTEGFLWTPQEGLISLGDVNVVAINDLTVIAGDRQTGEVGPNGELLTEAVAVYYNGNEIVDLGTLPGFIHSFAIDINDAGQILGIALSEVYEANYFIWSPVTGAVELVPLIDPGEGWSIMEFTGINNSGQLIATAFPPTAGMRATIIQPIMPADMDFDADVDKVDFSLFQQCFGGAGSPESYSCPEGVLADLDLDGDVDCYDMSVFMSTFTAAR